MTSVCTGSVVFAAAGLLRGRPAAGHRKHLDQMKSIDPTIEVRPGARFVDVGDVITASGLSAGIDMALHVVSRLVSPERARQVREGINSRRARRMAESGTMTPFQLVGVPYTSMAESGGIANAISVFRGLDLAQRLAQLGVEDEGDMTLKGPSGVRGPSGLLNEEALDHLVERTHATVHSIRDRGRIPLMVGGDCPVLLGALASIGPGTGPGLVMLDGHEDAWPPSLSETGEASDSELGIALGLISDLSPTLAAWTPLVAGPRVALLGPRDSDEIAKRGGTPVAPHVALFLDDRSVTARGPERSAVEALEAIGEGEFWLHIDLDVLSPADFPAADYLQPGGLSWSELQELAATVLAGPGPAGVSVAIYNPDRDPGWAVARRVVDFVVRLVEEFSPQRSTRSTGR